jgi:hypothetical protein
MLSFGLIVCGLAIVYLAFYGEQRSFSIWDKYSRKYKKRSNGIIDKLNRPNYVVYRIHVYLLWPIMAAIGVSAFILGLLRLVL